eukprot:CAMPEP_0194697574 /NCGR_PEP_ID=MMETSP0295-20121207/23513_1 /TAXON_ID=39354 /ORGANISM="Heterosigma akashiwo, Strain CCMP2393" /LENGTH=452 /DNA_ID=CAMNT_0039590283 /DNA_START=12 /DNA_END=1370 /DNA_ORIENTATION=-
MAFEKIFPEEEGSKYLHVLPVLFYEFLALSLIKSLVPEMMNAYFGDWTYHIIGMSEAVKGILAFTSCSVFGKLSDRIGRKKCLFITVAGTCAPACLLAFTRDLRAFVAAQALSGVFACTFPLTFAYISDLVPKERRAPAYGLALATFGLSLSVGPAAGGFLARVFGAQAVFATTFLLVLVDLAYIAVLLPESNPGQIQPLFRVNSRKRFDLNKEQLPTDFNPLETLKVFKGDYFLSRVAVVTFLYYIGVWALVSTLMIYVTRQFHFTPLMIGYLMSSFGVCTMFSEGILVRYMVPMFGERLTLQLGLLGFSMKCVIIGLASQAWMIYSVMLVSVFSNLVYPSLSSLVSRGVGAGRQGEALGALNGVKALTEGFGPLLFGHLLAAFEGTVVPGAPYLVAAAFAAGALVTSFALPEDPDAAAGAWAARHTEDAADALELVNLLSGEELNEEETL